MDRVKASLFSDNSQSIYAENQAYYSLLMEQYKTYLATTESISQRRQTANAFFVSVNSLLISLVSFLTLTVGSETYAVALIALTGLSVSFMWYRLVRSYGDLNAAKFKVVHEIEAALPVKPYDAEWEAVGRGQDPKLYLPFTRIEKGVPILFMILHFTALVLVLANFNVKGI